MIAGKGDAQAQTGVPLLRRRGLLEPHQARRSIRWTFRLPPATGALQLRLAFWPGYVEDVRNLLTLSLFDPQGFRGAGHRHAPQQVVLIAPERATPGFLPGPLPAGDWTVELDCHCVLPSDGGGVEYDLEVSGLPAPPDLPGPAPVPPDPPEPAARAEDGAPRWLRGDLHLHSDHSDGRWTVDEIVRYAEFRRLDFIAITEHNTNSVTPELLRAVRRAGSSLIVVPGMELTTFYGHANALGLTEWIDWRVAPPERHADSAGGEAGPVRRTMAEAAAEVRRRGGTFVINHPRAIGYPHCTGCRWEFGDESAGYADLVEVWNGPWRRPNAAALALWDAWLNAGYRIPAVAGSDGHLWPRQADTVGLTCVFAPPDPQAILAAVRAGRSYLSSGPALLLRRPPPGAPLSSGADAVSVTLEGLQQPVDVHLVADGDRVAQRTATADGEITFRLPAERARWYRVEAFRQGSDLPVALSNPIYHPTP